MTDLDVIATLDARNAERAALDALFNLRPESFRHEHTDRP